MAARMPANGELQNRVREAAATAINSAMKGVRPDIPYQLDDLVGRGSFGAVFRAHKIATGELVAIKVLNMDAPDEGEVKDAIREVNLLSQLKWDETQNINRYHESFLEGAKLWVVMDFCSGGSIRTLFKAGKLEERYIQVIIREVLLALCYIHRNGIIHRDIKAANILINKDGRVQLCDFGVSAQLSMSNGKRSTFVGTPWWMAPEVIMDGATYNSKADIWSLGITVIEMANTRPPLNDLEPMRAIMLIPRQPPPRLEGGTWTNGLREFVALCLNEAADARPSAEELLKTKMVKGCKTPTSILKELIVRYENWKNRGGVRHSILPQMGGPDNILGADDHLDEMDWDFDTIKSRLSGVPTFHNQLQHQMDGDGPTYKPVARNPSPMRLKDPSEQGKAHPLLQLFAKDGESYQESSNANAAMPVIKEVPHASGPSTRAPSPDGFVQIDMDEIFSKGISSPVSYQTEPGGMISIPDFPDTYRALPATVRAPSPPAVETVVERPKPTHYHRREPSAFDPNMIPTLDHNPTPPSPPREPRAPSPVTNNTRPSAVVSAPSSPPRQANQPNMQLAPSHANLGHKGHHLPSKSAPSMAALREAQGSGAPPVPAVTDHSKLRSADAATGPHIKARSQDISASSSAFATSSAPPTSAPPPPPLPAPQQLPLPRQPGHKPPLNRPSNLNLKGPNNKLTSLDGPGMLPPSPSRPIGGPSPFHTPHPSVSSTSTTVNVPPTPSFSFPLPTAVHVSESWELPVLEPVNLGVLAHGANSEDLLAELDRVLSGMAGTLEVMSQGLEVLAGGRRREREGSVNNGGGVSSSASSVTGQRKKSSSRSPGGRLGEK